MGALAILLLGSGAMPSDEDNAGHIPRPHSQMVQKRPTNRRSRVEASTEAKLFSSRTLARMDSKEAWVEGGLSNTAISEDGDQSSPHAKRSAPKWSCCEIQ